jgi:hypothetical protein
VLTIKTRTAVLVLALLCLLSGLALGQIMQADSARAGGGAQLDAISRKLGKISVQLGTISNQIGPTISASSVQDRLDQIADNTKSTCDAVSKYGIC